jgi:hypothetical protein
MTVPSWIPIQLGGISDAVPMTAVLGVGAAALVWGSRLAIRKRREARTPGTRDAATALRTDGEGIATARSTGSGAPDVALRVPLPFSGRPNRPVSHAEIYAVELGIVGGAMLAWVASLAVVDPLVGTLFGAAMGAISVWRVRSMASETVGRATLPWLGATVLGTAIGVIAFF